MREATGLRAGQNFKFACTGHGDHVNCIVGGPYFKFLETAEDPHSADKYSRLRTAVALVAHPRRLGVGTDNRASHAVKGFRVGTD